MSLKIYAEDDLELIRLIRDGLTNNGICYRLNWGLGALKVRIIVLFKLANVRNKRELRAKFRGVDLDALQE